MKIMKIPSIKSLLSEPVRVDFDVPLTRFTDLLKFNSIKVMEVLTGSGLQGL